MTTPNDKPRPSGASPQIAFLAGVLFALAGVAVVLFMIKAGRGERSLFHELELNDHSWGPVWQCHGPYYDKRGASVYVDRLLNFVVVLGPQPQDERGGLFRASETTADIPASWGNVHVEARKDEMVFVFDKDKKLTIPIDQGFAAFVYWQAWRLSQDDIIEVIQSHISEKERHKLVKFLTQMDQTGTAPK